MNLWHQLICLLIVLFTSLGVHAEAAQYRNGIPVLLYHHVSDDNSDLPKLTITPAEFERQMAMLKNAGFQTILPGKLIAYMKNEPVTLPAKPIIITFDDGYEDNYANAFPILKRFGFRAVIFMVGINLDQDKRLSSHQIQEMSSYGITFGGHSVTHRDLTTLTATALNHEVKDIKKKLSILTTYEADLFAYPYGYFNLATWEAVAAAGYQAAFTILPGLNNSNQDNIYLLRRIPIYSTTDFSALFILLNANQPKARLLEYSPERTE